MKYDHHNALLWHLLSLASQQTRDVDPVLLYCWSAFDTIDMYATLNVIYHPLYGMNKYVLIWGDWLSCDPLRGSHDSRSPHIWGIGYHMTLSEGHMIANHPI